MVFLKLPKYTMRTTKAVVQATVAATVQVAESDPFI